MATSPRPKVKAKTNGEVVDQMDFYTALRGIEDGKRKISRVEWGNPNIVFVMTGEYLTTNIDDKQQIDGQFHPLMLRYADMIAKDWFYV